MIRIRLFILDMKSVEACKQGIKIHMYYNSKFTLKMNTRNIVIQSVGSIQSFKATLNCTTDTYFDQGSYLSLRRGECTNAAIGAPSLIRPLSNAPFNYFGGARSKGFATLRNVSKLRFFDKIGQAKSVGFRFYSAIWRSESRISSNSLIYSLTFSRKKELLFWLSLVCYTEPFLLSSRNAPPHKVGKRMFSQAITKWDRTTSWYLEIAASLVFNYSRNK